MMYKLVALDIDGTLLDKNRALSSKTKIVLEKVSKRAHVILISSRMPAAMRHLQLECGISSNPMVAYNGGLVLHERKIFHHSGINFETFKTVLNLNRDLGLHLSLFHQDEWYAPKEDFWSEREINNTKVNPIYKDNTEVYNIWRSALKEPHKIMCMGDEEKVDIIFERLNNETKSHLHLYRSKPTYLEMAPKQISKLSGLEMLIEKFYPKLSLKDIIAFGDNYNDIEMLKNVGLGVAVGNAKDEVKAIADDITDSNIDDGVANYLQKIFKLKL